MNPATDTLTPWKDRIEAVERARAANGEFWKETIRQVYCDALVPAAEEFRAVLGAHVETRLTQSPNENKVMLTFDDWYLDPWSLLARVLPTTAEAAILEIGWSPHDMRRKPIHRAAPIVPEPFVEWLAEAYLDRISTEA